MYVHLSMDGRGRGTPSLDMAWDAPAAVWVQRAPRGLVVELTTRDGLLLRLALDQAEEDALMRGAHDAGRAARFLGGRRLRPRL